MTLQADLAEATMLRQRQDETLHQRERELTALKGALKEEVECHDREMEALREQYSQDMENLRRTMEQVTQVENTIFCILCKQKIKQNLLGLKSSSQNSIFLGCWRV